MEIYGALRRSSSCPVNGCIPMSKPIDHIAYLSQEIGPRPAGTEEEQQSALYITDRLQKEAHLAVNIEDFACNPDYYLPRFFYLAITLVCAVLGHFVSSIAPAMTVIAFLSAAAYVAELLGYPLLSRLFNNGVSQNVVAKYTPEVTDNQRARRRRKIIVVANYDSGKVRADYHHALIGALHPLQIAELVGMIAIPFMMLLRVTALRTLSGSGSVAYAVLMVILLACIVIPIVFIVMERVAPYNESANNNAAGVAVMLEVARRLGCDLVPITPDQEPGLIHDEKTARDEGLVPEGADIEYEAEGSQTEEQTSAEPESEAVEGQAEPAETSSAERSGSEERPETASERAEAAEKGGESVGGSVSSIEEVENAPVIERVVQRPAQQPAETEQPAASSEAAEPSEATSESPVASEKPVAGEGAAATARDVRPAVAPAPERTAKAAATPNASVSTAAMAAAAAMPTAKVASNVPEWYRVATEKARKNIEERGGVTEQFTFRSQYADVPVNTPNAEGEAAASERTAMSANAPAAEAAAPANTSGAAQAQASTQGASSAPSGEKQTIAQSLAAAEAAAAAQKVWPPAQEPPAQQQEEKPQTEPAPAAEPESAAAPAAAPAASESAAAGRQGSAETTPEPSTATADFHPASGRADVEAPVAAAPAPASPAAAEEPELPTAPAEPELEPAPAEAELEPAPEEPELEPTPVAGELDGASTDEPKLEQPVVYYEPSQAEGEGAASAETETSAGPEAPAETVEAAEPPTSAENEVPAEPEAPAEAEKQAEPEERAETTEGASAEPAESEPAETGASAIKPGDTAEMPPITADVPYEERSSGYVGPSYVNTPDYPEEDEDVFENGAAKANPRRATRPLPMYYTPPKDRSALMRERAEKPRVMVSSDLPDEDGYVVDRPVGQPSASAPATVRYAPENPAPTQSVPVAPAQSAPAPSVPTAPVQNASATPFPAAAPAPATPAQSAPAVSASEAPVPEQHTPTASTSVQPAVAQPVATAQTSAPVTYPAQREVAPEDEDLGATVAMPPISMGEAAAEAFDTLGMTHPHAQPQPAAQETAPEASPSANGERVEVSYEGSEEPRPASEAAADTATPEDSDLGATVAMPPIDVSALREAPAPAVDASEPTPAAAAAPANAAEQQTAPQEESEQTADINIQRSASVTQVMDPVFGRQQPTAPTSRPLTSTGRISIFEKLPDIKADDQDELKPLDLDDLRRRGAHPASRTRDFQVIEGTRRDTSEDTGSHGTASEDVPQISDEAYETTAEEYAEAQDAAYDDVNPDDISTEDIDTTPFDEDDENEPVYADDPDEVDGQAEHGAHANPDKKRRGGFFSRFRRNKKKDDETSMTDELGLDKDFNAREEGKKISWDDLSDDDWEGGAFSNLRNRLGSNDDQDTDEVGRTRRSDRGAGRRGSSRGGSEARAGRRGNRDNDQNASGRSQRRREREQYDAPAEAPEARPMDVRTDADELADVAALAAHMEAEREEQQSAFVPATETLHRQDTERSDEPSDEVKQIYSFANGSVTCEVWFVGLGSQYADNQGMKAFLAQHADEMRGAVVINLEALGRGDVRYVEKEGVVTTGKLSARLKRIVRRAAQASGMSVDGTSLLWRDDAASYAQKHRLQAVTLAGIEDGKPSLLGDADDAIENIDEELLDRSADMVIELIKNI
jgi:hypothetical protein